MPNFDHDIAAPRWRGQQIHCQLSDRIIAATHNVDCEILFSSTNSNLDCLDWTFWAVESMIDELAHASGKDPAQYRIALLDGKGKNDGGAQRLRNTLLAAMGLAGYGTKQLPKGEGMGVACVSSQERATASWTACVAHVAVADNGEVKVKKLTVATDVGTQVHPDNIRAQVEGAALWGLSLAMYENATLKNGAIRPTSTATRRCG